jgi:hypothetical protein
MRYHRIRHAVAAAGVSALLALAGGAVAQEIEIEAEPPAAVPEAPPPRQLEVLTPPGAREITRPRESDFYPEDIRVRLEPAFIQPFTNIPPHGPKPAVQFGLAGWTAPNTPVAHHEGYFHENQGWFALGFAVVWGGPEKKATPTPAGSPR